MLPKWRNNKQPFKNNNYKVTLLFIVLIKCLVELYIKINNKLICTFAMIIRYVDYENVIGKWKWKVIGKNKKIPFREVKLWMVNFPKMSLLLFS